MVPGLLEDVTEVKSFHSGNSGTDTFTTHLHGHAYCNNVLSEFSW